MSKAGDTVLVDIRVNRFQDFCYVIIIDIKIHRVIYQVGCINDET